MKKMVLPLVLLLITNLIGAQNTILWSINKSDSEKTSYILGTFHQMGNSFIDDRPEIKRLLNKSDIVIFESIEDRYENITKVMLNRTDDFSYREYLNKDDVDFLEEYTANWEVPISKHKPAELLVRLEQEYSKKNCGTINSNDTSEHMDEYLQSMVNQDKSKILGLESRSDQFNAINIVNNEEMTWEKAKNAFSNLESKFQKNKFKKRVCAMAKNYMKMKLDYQFEVKCAENDGILSNRNEKWMPIIENAIKNYNSAFIAVGLLHLQGQCGIIEQLRKNGYEVNPVKL
ncbi:TraB/GumN family protein [Sediminibacter sp. Hel_I_10]|uniref:TraB/GumN family protein n=1 Tax=Sediminibacter sp. Hel_I_10 TaxID=1392490 RepID=UPI0018CC712A|nr:TraB/GumN family protein [Sediminibacter sp. Hel_I_10]